MTSIVTKKSRTRRLASYVVPILLVSFALIVLKAYAHSYGQNSATNKVGSTYKGCDCHGVNSSSATTVTLNTSATSIFVGQTYTFTVTVSNSGKSQGGTNVAVQRGTLTAGSGLQSSGGELVHTQKASLPATWTFTYTAPSTTGWDTIFATGNAVDNNGNESGDQWNFAQKYLINVLEPPVTKAMAVSRFTVDLGNVRVGKTKKDTIKIYSTSTDAITVNTSMKLGTYYTTSPTGSNRSISGGSNEVNEVTFAPSVRGVSADSLIITSNADAADGKRKAIYFVANGIAGIYSGGPTTMAFGDVKVGQTKKIGYVFQNTGDDTLFLATPTITGAGFSILTQPTRLSLAPNEKDSVVVLFTPTTKQASSGSLKVDLASGSNAATVTLSGQGTVATVSINPITFIGGARPGMTIPANIDVKNTGNDTLRVTAISLVSGGDKFTLNTSAPIVVLGGETKQIQLSYKPTAVQADTAVVRITTDIAGSAPIDAKVYGLGTVPRMSVQKLVDTVDFGAVKVGTTANKDVRILNTGSDVLTISSAVVSPTPPFSFVSKNTTIDVAAAGFVRVAFAPTTSGEFTGRVIVSGDDPDKPTDTVFFKGSGTNSAISLPTELAFASVEVGKNLTKTVTIMNEGTAGVTINSFKLTGSATFSITDSSKHTVAAGESIDVAIKFSPTAPGEQTGTLEIRTDDATAPLRTVSLSGTGFKATTDITVDPSSLDFGQVKLGATGSKSVTIKNNGTSAIVFTQFPTITCTNAFSIAPPLPNPVLGAGESATVTLTYTPTVKGIEECQLTIPLPDATSLVVQLRGEGIEDKPLESVEPSLRQSLRMSLVPNPATDRADVRLQLDRAMDISFVVTDAAGRLIMTTEARSFGIGEFRAPIVASQLANGEYIVRAIANGVVIGEQKLIVQR